MFTDQIIPLRKYFSSYVAIILTISPVFLALVWHINNHGWPSDDPANYMMTAYQQYRAFQDGTLLDGLQAMYQIRGWRPILFPVLATPFLWLFRGDVLAATGVTLVLCFLVCQIYIYAIARRYLDPLRAAAAAAFVGSGTIVASQALIFFSEIAWLALFGGFVFHVLESQEFRRPWHAAIAGIYLGIATTVRPAETVVVILVPFAILFALAIARASIGIMTVVRALGLVISIAVLLIIAAFVPAMDYRILLPLGSIIIAVLFWVIKLNKEKEPGATGLGLLTVFLLAINLLWWANSMPILYSWVYETSFGSMAQITTKPEGFFVVFKRILALYLYPQGVILILLSLIMMLPSRRKDFPHLRGLTVFAVLTLALLLPMFILYAVTGTSDARRVFIGMAFIMLFLSIFSLQAGALQPVRDACVMAILGLQLIGFLWAARAEAPPFQNLHWIKTGVSFPKTKPDQNEILINKLLELGIPRESSVAVYTMALFQARDRVYEPAALQLAAATTGSNLDILYYWDIGEYFSVIDRLRTNNVRYLLIDNYRDPTQAGKHQPSYQFASSLLDRLNVGKEDPLELRRIDSFMLDGREQILFEVRQPKITASSQLDKWGSDGLLIAKQPGWHAQFPPKYPEEVQIDFGSVKQFESLGLAQQLGTPGRSPKAIEVSTSIDGVNWNVVLNTSDACQINTPDGWTEMPLKKVVTAKQVRIKIFSNCGSEYLTLRGIRFAMTEKQ